MDIRYLYSFISVAEHLNFTKAAKELYIGQPSLSRQIQKLEKQIDAKLLMRNSNSVVLTPAGEILLEEVKPLLSELEKILDKARQENLNVTGLLRIGSLGVEKELLAKAIRRFRSKHPKIEIVLEEMGCSNIRASLRHGSIDLAMSLAFEFLDDSLVTRKISSYKVCVVVNDEHPLWGVETVALEEIRDESFILHTQAESGGGYDFTCNLCVQRGFVPKIIGQPGTLQTILLQVEAGIGVAILSRNIETTYKHNLHFVEVSGEDAYVDTCMAWRMDNENPLLPLFLEELQDCLDSVN